MLAVLGCIALNWCNSIVVDRESLVNTASANTNDDFLLPKKDIPANQ